MGEQQSDVTINNLLPVYNTRLLKSYALLDHRVVTVVREVKKWAQEIGLHGADKGHLSSYSFTLLGIFYFQVKAPLPSVQALAETQSTYADSSGRVFDVSMAPYD